MFIVFGPPIISLLLVLGMYGGFFLGKRVTVPIMIAIVPNFKEKYYNQKRIQNENEISAKIKYYPLYTGILMCGFLWVLSLIQYFMN